ncbi:MAG: polyamine aminopropyltransferase [Syntrophomonadaceae bacterium]|nr:polyamine aminopropyltransferase [Syntrophomonadaceae bacterium]
MQGVWFSEAQSANLGFSCRVKSVLHKEKTDFQDLLVLDTETFDRMLVLDGAIQTTIVDEFAYHEMISMVAVNSHPVPNRVLVIGGGDGGAIREIIRHPKVNKASLVEIDERVVECAKKYLPEISVALNNEKVEVLIEDGIKHIKEKSNYYDVVIVDSTDPIGPAVGLFNKDFYGAIFRALKDDGIMVAQTESPWFNKDLIRRVFSDIKGIFPIAKLYIANVPTYPSGMWSFTIGSKVYDPEKVSVNQIPDTGTKYYSQDTHFAVFKLPPFVKALLEQEV